MERFEGLPIARFDYLGDWKSPEGGGSKGDGETEKRSCGFCQILEVFFKPRKWTAVIDCEVGGWLVDQGLVLTCEQGRI